jgi:hypothetical protein
MSYAATDAAAWNESLSRSTSVNSEVESEIDLEIHEVRNYTCIIVTLSILFCEHCSHCGGPGNWHFGWPPITILQQLSCLLQMFIVLQMAFEHCNAFLMGDIKAAFITTCMQLYIVVYISASVIVE